jgi:hypothetical protein
MNTESNEPEFAAALEKLRSEGAARFKIVFNPIVLNYAMKECRNIRMRSPALSPEEAVLAAVNGFPDSTEGVAYCNTLIRIFVVCYTAFVEKRLRWACGEGFIPVQTVMMLHSVITETRLAYFRSNPLAFDLGNPRAATPNTVAEQARAQALRDVDGNLERISAVFEKMGGLR